MRTQRKLTTALIGAALLLLAGLPTLFAQSAPQYTTKDLNEQTVMGLVWMQNSAEYRELCYQAYNMAGMLVDKAVAAKGAGDKPLAIIADLDEALIDNSAYDAGLIGTDSAYSSKTWLEWENAALARAMPGAADFLQGVAKKGVAVFYVTNRDQAGLEGTMKNLEALGYPFVDATHVLVQTSTGDKQPRFDSITQNYQVVVYIGDNANDMPIGTYHKSMAERNALVDQNKEKYGAQFIVLPNPVYGDWEGVLANGYWGLSPKGKDEARKADLRTWVPGQ
ncbi:MAG TPA: 5'-nucleotidase, lipoprotein e(P4) family [Spirochaetia bacterium]|nr:5'-nucleotidase, lipoprotein e(P4) family [Spirochaetia bacterium]